MARGKRRYISLLPPQGRQTHTARVPGLLVCALACVLACGFAGYFIPFNRFSIDKVEVNQKRNLDRTNIDLLRRIHDMQPMVRNLQDQLAQLVQRRTTLVGDAGSADSSLARKPVRSAAIMDIEELFTRVSRYEAFWQRLGGTLDARPGYFRALPVLLPMGGTPVLAVPFGRQRDPFTGATKLHQGIDLVAPRGTPVVATADGIVSSVVNDRKWGLRVDLSHAAGFTTMYAHLAGVTVRRGEQVKRGESVGTLGSTGLATGPHLHYEVRRNGVPLDPRTLFFPSLDSTVSAVPGLATVE
jgi:murein DD-endopeptidase MepM/ murein hydrolase activator NlpD